MDKLRIVVDVSLTGGAIAAQAVHAAVAFSIAHPEAFADWHSTSNTVVILAAEQGELASMRPRLESVGVPCAGFHEPDRGGALTAVAVAPSEDARLLTRHLSLAGAAP